MSNLDQMLDKIGNLIYDYLRLINKQGIMNMSKRNPEFEQARTNHSSQRTLFAARKRISNLAETKASYQFRCELDDYLAKQNLDNMTEEYFAKDDKPILSISVAFKFLLKYWGQK